MDRPARPLDAPADDEEALAGRARTVAPIVWLIGKVQSGKSSIVRRLTGSSEAEVGDGFRACTGRSRIFEFPEAAPVIRFLDTRGLGEVAYDPGEDLAFAEDRAQLLLVVMKALDHQQAAVVEAVRAVRVRHPDWPVLVAQTCLHEGYGPGVGHLLPYAYGDLEGAPVAGLPSDLARSLLAQRRLLAGLPGKGPVAFVPIDLTRPDDGLSPADYGLEALTARLVEVAPAGLGAMIRELHRKASDTMAQAARPLILGYATAAAAADLVPLAGLLAVPGIQARLLHRLAGQYGTTWDQRTYTEFGGALGAGILTRLAAGFGIREVAKLIPVYGQTAGSAAAAAASFATTYALGQAACYFLARRRLGESDPHGVARAYREELVRAFGLAGEVQAGKGAGSGPGVPAEAGR